MGMAKAVTDTATIAQSIYTFVQSTPTTIWHIAHNLDGYPVVVAVDNSGNVVEPAVQYTDVNTVVLTFDVAVSGKAYLSGISGSNSFPDTIVTNGTYVFTQSVAATTWNIAHNLGEFPSVDVVDSTGTVITAQVQYVDNNNVTITFDVAVSGKAYLN